MEYPGSSFTKPRRKAMLVLFVLAFFIISPLTLAYTVGYRYDWKQGLIKEIGAISVDVLPKQATVYINNQKINEKIPIRLSSVTPNNYNLRVSLDGYYDWNKEIKVKNKQTVYIKEIELIKKNKPKLLQEGEIKILALSPQGDYIVFETQDKDKKQIKILNNKNLAVKSILTFSSKDETTVKWNELNNYFIVAPSPIPSEIYVFNADKLDNKVILKTDNEEEKMTNFEWNKNINPEIYFGTKNEIWSYDLVSEQKNSLLKEKFIDWYLYNNELWTLETSSSSNEMLIYKNKLVSPSLFATFSKGNFVSKPEDLNNWKILTINGGTVLLKRAGQTNAVLVSPNQETDISESKFLISDFNNWWLIWTPWELWSYSDGSAPALLNRSGEQLSEVLPLDKYNTLLLVWAKKTSIFFPYYGVNHDFLNTTFTSVKTDLTNKTLYFTAKIDNQNGIWKLAY